MIFKQYYLGCLAHASYLIADESTRAAVVVDPQRDVEQYIEDARLMDLTIRHVYLTHFHADFVAGHLELRDRCGASIHLGVKGEAEYEFVPESDGTRLEMGDVRLESMETPGHTPEGICILVYDLKENKDRPQMVLTGDTLFIGDVGRPDLMASVGITAEELASLMYDSLHDKLMKLPDQTLVYPAHGAGSLCGKNLSDETVSTIGEQKRLNYALQPMDRESFIRMMTENLPAAPEYFPYDAQLNRKERLTLDRSLETGMKELTLDELLALQKEGAQVLDTRPETEFNAAHLKGTVQVGLGGKFATWAGIVLKPDIPIVLITEPGTEYESEMRLGRIGFDQVSGFLKDGMKALAGRPDLVESTPGWTVEDWDRAKAQGQKVRVLDVRSPAEYNEGHIRDALNVPLNTLQERMDEVPRDGDTLVHCAGGYRSTIACSLLQKAGRKGIINLLGGLGAFPLNHPVNRDLVTASA
ncbi:putative Beta-lactamase-like protein [Nitrospina gracilis 3/211]|uniref:Putative Beta-lactamase-like protein n=1 Tax=Nitrospina gracilis (strain 3/211) TaxID=1266370 RepID=M1YZC8_NITG3|nr:MULTISPECIES: MBL fold metallo-hydrolase [Nitrospina]MCF8723533.1 glyoxylase-like metal-dependent hydrolase (beta-lactamase superfamily II)/rhodanese-related sulfurtransferase [Nitrospina sp. Nb-3]CCQ90604.1 putative Beta-lactamase-like protein [Nitrospina gracilis 3/211]